MQKIVQYTGNGWTPQKALDNAWHLYDVDDKKIKIISLSADVVKVGLFRYQALITTLSNVRNKKEI